VAAALEPSRADEFAIIAAHFAPLARHPFARGLLDDVARVETDAPLVITTDAIVEGVHFLPDDPIDAVAQKALRVNLSDLAGKGAAPFGYLLTLFWPNTRAASEIASFAAGLGRDQAEFGVTLLGGDTAATPGPLSVSITMLGSACGRTPARSDAQTEEDVWVTGTIGDGGLGLAAAHGASFPPDDRDALIERFRRPTPRVKFAAAITTHARASIDLSDGLLADASKVASASRVALEIDADAIPVSEPAARWIARQDDRDAAIVRLASSGDDYEILFTAPAAARTAIEADAKAASVPVRRIGRVTGGEGVRLMRGGAALSFGAAGFVHRLGR
jgi:thiamine-monophosphate kinase